METYIYHTDNILVSLVKSTRNNCKLPPLINKILSSNQENQEVLIFMTDHSRFSFTSDCTRIIHGSES